VWAHYEILDMDAFKVVTCISPKCSGRVHVQGVFIGQSPKSGKTPGNGPFHWYELISYLIYFIFSVKTALLDLQLKSFCCTGPRFAVVCVEKHKKLNLLNYVTNERTSRRVDEEVHYIPATT